jgi:hypothetical protein
MTDQLKEELLKPVYRGLTDQQAADTLNAKRVSARRLVPTWEVRRAAIEGGYWPSLVLSAADANDARRGLAISVLAWIDDQSGTIQTIDMDRSSTQQMLTGLVAANFVTQPQADALNALADVTIPWTDSVGLPEIGIGLVINARRA